MAEGTAEYVDDVIASLKDGSLKVFDTDTFTVEGQKVETAEVDFSYMDFSTMTAIYEGETKECIQDSLALSWSPTIVPLLTSPCASTASPEK